MDTSGEKKFAGKTVLITGASRGIGKAIGLRVARDGANVVIAAKTAEPHPHLPGTIYTAAEEIEKAGGKCLPCVVDVRDERQVEDAVHQAVKRFGRIDIVVNNASAISLTGTLQTPMKRYDLMHQINTRGTFLVSQKCIPYLKDRSVSNPHILNISPPLNMSPKWFGPHVAYTMAKYGMSMCVLGMADELRNDGIAVNALWPRTAIYTAAMEMLGGGSSIADQCRKPEIMADAAYVMLSRNARDYTGNFAIDEDVLKEAGVTDLSAYACKPGHPLLPDFFLDEIESPEAVARMMAEGGADPKWRAGKEQPTAPTGRPSESKKSAASSGIAGIFDTIRQQLSADLVKGVGASYEFKITDSKCAIIDTNGVWHLDLKSGNGACGEGASPTGKADTTFSMNEATFMDIFTGKKKATAAFMGGAMRIQGDMGKALKLEKVLAAAKSNM